MAHECLVTVSSILNIVIKNKITLDLSKFKDSEEKNLLLLSAKMGPVGQEICRAILQNLKLFGGDRLLTQTDKESCCALHYLFIYGSPLIIEFQLNGKHA